MISPSFGQILVLVFFITLFTRSWAFSLERRSTSHFMLRTFERFDPVSHLLTSGPFSGFSGRIRPTTIRFVPFRFSTIRFVPFRFVSLCPCLSVQILCVHQTDFLFSRISLNLGSQFTHPHIVTQTDP